MKSTTRNFLLYVLIAFLGVSCAQSRLNSGKEAYNTYRFTDAISHLEKGLSKKSDTPARLMLADAYLRLNQFDKAASAYAQANLDPAMKDSSRLRYGQALMSNRQYEDAQGIFEGIIARDGGNKLAADLLASCKRTDSMFRDSALYEVSMVDLPGVNASYAPVWIDSGLVVTSVSPKAGLKDPYTKAGYSDLYFVKSNGDGWTQSSQMQGLNSRYHDAAPSFSADGKTMVFTHSMMENGNRTLHGDASNFNNMQLYTAMAGADGSWSEPERLNFNEDAYMYAHPALSADGKSMVFSSDRQGGFGGMDLWAVSHDGSKWGDPVNLGPGVNTPGNELFPSYKSADTLYFSSNAHETLGGLDMHYSVKNGSQWSTPTHLTYPVNSAADDFGMTFKSANEGYFSSDRSGSDGVYHFLHTDPEIVAKGVISNDATMMPVEGAEVTIINLTDGTEEKVTTGSDGSFEVKLETGKEYEFVAEHEDYFTDKKKKDTIGKTDDEQVLVPFDLERLIVNDTSDSTGSGDGSGSGSDSGSGSGDGSDSGSGSGSGTGTGSGSGSDTGSGSGSDSGSGSGSGHSPTGVGTYPVPNIYWDYNSWEVKPESEPYLDDLVKTLKNNPSLTVQIRSHCDCRGSHGFNDVLSSKRAKAVTDYLISKGIPRVKLQSRGIGKRELVNDCDCRTKTDCSDFLHAKNRRTEFIVVAK